MSYVKTFMEDYLCNKSVETYCPVPIKYIIYNLKTNQFRSSNNSSVNEHEHSIETLCDQDNFTIFISHAIDEEYFFIESTNKENCEEKIYDYYGFYDVEKNKIDISQEYSVFIDCESKVFNITTTKFSSNKKIDSFEVVHFERE